MDFFEVYPQLKAVSSPFLTNRALRLIAISAIVYDEHTFYFEISRRDMWGRLSNGRSAIGIGATKISPDLYNNAPPQALSLHLRKTWRYDVSPVSSQQTYILEDNQQTAMLHMQLSGLPYMLILTTPRLAGGDEMPDALVQSIHLLRVQRFRKKLGNVNLLKIKRDAWRNFLGPVDWDIHTLAAQPWAEFSLSTPLPQNAKIRPVLVLRGLQRLLKLGDLPQTLIPTMEED